MKTPFSCHARWKLAASLLAVLSLTVPAGSTIAAELKEARVTQIVKEVQLLPAQAAPRPAAVNDSVRDGTAVRTGAASRTELTFTDQTLARLGANTIFSFNEGTRNLELRDGAMLLAVPKGAGGAKISTAAVTAAITGTTVLMEYHRNAYIKFISLEGVARIFLKRRLGESVLIHPGQMLIVNPNAKSLPDPVDVDLKRILKSSLLLTSFPPLASEPLILQEIQIQEDNSNLIPTNLVIFGGGTLVSLVNPTNLDVISQATTAMATPTPPPPTPTPSPSPSASPSKFGPPTVISSPVPYVITSGTTIMTDPAITTNGVTDFGTIWRGQATDGPLSAFVFGSTSTFDTASGFDTELSGQNSTGGAVFKFTSLQLTGNPTVSTPTGVNNLGLIAVNGITSGSPGGTLTFAGIRGLLIATQNGPINLGPEISFSGLHDINFYARGTGSNLTLGSAISADARIRLFAEGTIQVNGAESATDFRAFSGGDFLAGFGVITAQTIDVESLSNVNIDAGQFPNPSGDVTFIAAGTLNLTLRAGSSGTAHFTGTSLTADGSTINVQSGNPITFDLGTATVSVTAGSGGIQAPNIDFVYENLTLQSGADINIRSATFGSGNTVGAIAAATSFSASGDVDAHTLTAGTTVGVGGRLFVDDTLTAGGNINIGNFLQAVNINAPSGTLTVQAGIFPVLDTNFGPTLQHTFTVSSIVSPGGIDFSGNHFNAIDDGLSSGGLLTINANTLTFDSARGIAFANFNGADAGSFSNGGPASGGDGGTFIVNATGNIIANNGANITATTGINPAGVNFSGAGGTVNLTSSAGEITVSDTIQVSSAESIDTSSPHRTSSSGGKIALQSNAATGVAINITSSAQLLSLLDGAAPGPGGLITILATGTNSTVSAGGSIEADRGGVDIRHTGDSGQVTLNSALLRADIVKVAALGTNGVLNIGSSNSITADTLIKLYASGSNGTLNFLANVTLSSPSTILAANRINIASGVTVNIDSTKPADVFTNHPNYFGFGGTGTPTSSGTFSGAGANNPQPLASAPPIGPPGGP